ncbi:MAG: adenosylcobinamide-GDP ribazoletransferase [Acidimicrobiaceae bacterium]|nr:adenosylcobinamide-GDP ribazoletransferase [Acidimicrobiaceae bacterium]MCY3608013.1 adenosylcobinamide-GDP ribazoletransferase [Acidimicrobiaceae bacterium]MCY3894150.1 adenosylcobinamide-GDP ribazoletransferase [Acidimicrobiaceae bacterium]MCY3948753.1 adenosylcobinamide-GDP ribazoletransferase [Acidimicrobiaceae bacterium]
MSLRYAWAFLTRLPGGAHPPTERDLGRSVPWFPLVGAIVGAMGGAVFWAVWQPLGAPLAAILAVATGAVVTGAFHEDGLADTADALGGTTLEQRREIMKDSRLGTFGTLVLVLATLVQVFAVMPLAPRDAVIAMALAHGVGRTLAVAAMASAPTAPGSGLGHSYTAHLRGLPCALSLLLSYVAAFALGWVGMFAFGGATGAALVVALIAHRKFGGMTGDVLGAVVQVSQMAALVAVSRLLDDFDWFSIGWFWN